MFISAAAHINQTDVTISNKIQDLTIVSSEALFC